ncbi:MAG: 30S ribosomal protein S4 [Puniceicoccales bacterium]|jgi:small subunit ribosomal protein S4|nr:30S ribosomal protein S4 [Puniceicoccales bacterium]
MSRYTGPTSKINRRFGQNLFPVSKAEEHKPYPPGIHGPTKRTKVSEYGTGLNEKQKLRFMYGLNEKQFYLVFLQAKRQAGVTGENFLRLLHTRLDNVVYLLGFARTRRAARQLVGHGHITVNGHKVDIPSYVLGAGDVIEIRSRTSSRQLATRGTEENQQRVVPAWLTLETTALKGSVNRLPAAEELPSEINVQLIVEFYSR